MLTGTVSLIRFCVVFYRTISWGHRSPCTAAAIANGTLRGGPPCFSRRSSCAISRWRSILCPGRQPRGHLVALVVLGHCFSFVPATSTRKFAPHEVSVPSAVGGGGLLSDIDCVEGESKSDLGGTPMSGRAEKTLYSASGSASSCVAHTDISYTHRIAPIQRLEALDGKTAIPGTRASGNLVSPRAQSIYGD